MIVATGGVSYPHCLTGTVTAGKAGRAYGRAAQSSLVPLVTPGGCEELMGHRNVQVTVFEDSRRIWSEFGEMLFTFRPVRPADPLRLRICAISAAKSTV
ncbi:MAG: hypothetical protein ACLT14_08050 [Butyricicoccaceae bacterium]